MSQVITYNQIIQDYIYHLALIFRANNPDERRDAFYGLYSFKNLIEEAEIMASMKQFQGKIENKVITSNILSEIKKSLNSTFDMQYHQMDFKQILSKMHNDLDDYKKLLDE